jgi:glycosyltransferase involved in cell wall biosynthesis
MSNPKVSVVIPTYNRADTLPRAMDSVLNQTFQDFELIIVDDGSTDNTKRVVAEKKEKNNRTIYLKQKNQGAAVARNTGIKKSKGKYIAFLDSDDEWAPEKLEKQLRIFEVSDLSSLGFVGSNKIIYGLNEYGEIVTKKNLYKDRFPHDKKRFTLEEFLSLHTPVSPTSALILKKALLDVGMFDPECPPHEDYDLWIRLRKKYNFDTTWEVLAKYYDWDGGISNTTSSFRKAQVKEYMLKKHKNVYKRYPKAKSIILRKTGTEYILAGKKGKAIKYFLLSIRAKPLYFRNYFNLLISLLGERVYKKILNIYTK